MLRSLDCIIFLPKQGRRETSGATSRENHFDTEREGGLSPWPSRWPRPRLAGLGRAPAGVPSAAAIWANSALLRPAPINRARVPLLSLAPVRSSVNFASEPCGYQRGSDSEFAFLSLSLLPRAARSYLAPPPHPHTPHPDPQPSMSAYGPILRASATDPSTLVPRSLLLPNGAAMTVFPCTRATAPPALVAYLAAVFNAVVAEGRTYPQLGELSEEQFAAYFFAEDCFVGLLDRATEGVRAAGERGVDREKGLGLEEVRAGRSYEECVLGMFCEFSITKWGGVERGGRV